MFGVGASYLLFMIMTFLMKLYMNVCVNVSYIIDYVQYLQEEQIDSDSFIVVGAGKDGCQRPQRWS